VILKKHHANRGYWGSRVIAPRIVDLGTRWGWSALRPGLFIPRERAPGSQWIGGWLGRRTGLDVVEKRKIPSTCQKHINEVASIRLSAHFVCEIYRIPTKFYTGSALEFVERI
jgi:hypothetical protein